MMYFLFSIKVPGSLLFLFLLLICAALQILLLAFRSALSRSVSRCFPQSSLHISSDGTCGVLISHWREANGPSLPRPPSLPDHFCPYSISGCHPTTRLCPQAACHRQSGQTCTPLDVFPLLPSPASLKKQASAVRFDCSDFVKLLLPEQHLDQSSLRHQRPLFKLM